VASRSRLGRQSSGRGRFGAIAFLPIIVHAIVVAIILTSVLIQAIQIRGGDLHGVEKNSGLFRVETAVQQVFADLRNRRLDRDGIFEDGQEEESGGLSGRGADVELYWTTPLVEVAKLLIAQGGRFALRSIHFHTLASFDGMNWHG